jgi:hypothetical protein
MNNSHIQKWFEQRSHKDRLGLLIIGCICISCFWYIYFYKQLVSQIKDIQTNITANVLQVKALKQQMANIMKDVELEKLQPELAHRNMTIESLPNENQLIKQLLIPQPGIVFRNLTNLSSGNSYFGAKFEFSSNYLNAIVYLKRIEKLPWCLVWDSLEYKVTHYPEAIVMVNLHVVKT